MRLQRSPLVDSEPLAAQIGRDRALSRVTELGRLATSKQILAITHGEDDYAWLDFSLDRPHRYEEGIAFVQGFYELLDSTADFAQEREQ